MKSVSFNVKIKNKKNLSGSIELENSNIILIKGEVGSGKTSILRSIYREYVLSRGKKNIAYASLDYPFLQKKTVKENIKSMQEYCKLDESLLNQNLSALQLSDLLDQKVSLLSEGEKLRFILCLSLANKAELVLIDEPTSKVDLITSKLIKELIMKRSKSKKLIIVTHDNIFDDICQSIYVVTDEGFNKVFSENNTLEIADKDQVETGIEDNNSAEKCNEKKKGLFHRPALFHQLKLISNFVFAFLFTYVFLFLSELSMPLKRNYNPLIANTESIYVFDLNSIMNDYVEPYKSFFPTGKELYFTVKNNSYVFDVSKSIARHLDIMPILENKNNKFEITSKLYEIMKKEFGNFDYHDLILAGNYCEGIISSKDIYISYPYGQKENILAANAKIYTNYKIYRTIGNADIIYDENFKQIDISTITSDEIVVKNYYDYKRIISDEDGVVETPLGTKKVVGFVPISNKIRADKSDYLLPNTLNISSINWHKNGNRSVYPTILMKKLGKEEPIEASMLSFDKKLLEEYKLYLNDNYKKQCIVFLISSLVVSSLALIVFVSLDNFINKDKKNQEFYFSSKRKYCFNNTFSIYDLSIFIPFLIITAIYFGAMKIFTFFNILTLVYFILAYILLFAVQYFSNYIIHYVKRKLLK